MILADTSVWIEFLRGRNPYLPVLRHHLEAGNVCTTDFIFGELLQGARDAKEAGIIGRYFAALPRANQTADLWFEAGRLSRELKAYSRGVGLIDVALIVAARSTRTQIWTKDKKLLGLLMKEEIFHAKK